MGGVIMTIFLLIFIGILLLIIGGMLWFLYFKPKCSVLNYNLGSITNQKKHVSKEYFDFIDTLAKFKELDDVFEAIFKELTIKESERLEAISKLQKQEKTYIELTMSLARKSKLIVDISHQMRTSLSGLLGFEKFLLETKLNTKQIEYVQLMSDSSQELLSLVDNILETAPRLNMNDEKKFLNQLEHTDTNAKPKILVVDDNDINRRLLMKILEKFDVVAYHAKNGKEAVMMRETEDFDIIFMDIEMPIMNGVDASINIRKFEKESGASSVPIVALTANTGKKHREKYLSAGMDDYMIKPIQINEVTKRIETLLA